MVGRVQKDKRQRETERVVHGLTDFWGLAARTESKVPVF